MPRTTPSESPYPIQHAFVVQFDASTDLGPESLSGRVEHVVSGQTTHFHSLQVLFAFVVQMLEKSRVPGDIDH
jgi:hypothetical protein